MNLNVSLSKKDAARLVSTSSDVGVLYYFDHKFTACDAYVHNTSAFDWEYTGTTSELEDANFF